MRNVLLVILAVAALGYYFDISPTDLLPSLPSSEAARDRHSSRATTQPPTAQAQAQPTAATTPVSNNADGSLASRWTPSASPAKP